MNRISWYFFLLGLLLCAATARAQKEYPIERVSVINVGDGRFLYRDLKTDKPLDGDRRIIDGYHSAYIQAEFKDGFYNGKYAEYEYNKLKCEGAYRDGRKEGTFKFYDSEGRVKEEKPYKDGKLHGAHRTFYTSGQLEREVNYRDGRQDGKELYYDYDGTLRREHNYRDGRQVGKQYSFIQGTHEYYETTYFNDQGLQEGDYTAIFTFGQPHITGRYANGQKDGVWTEIAESGDTLYIATYRAGREEGLQVRFSRETGTRTKEYYMKADRPDGLYREYDPDNGELIYEATYQYGRLHGKERRLVHDNRYDYWETSTFVNGRKTGPFESRYIKNDRVREAGEYRNGHRIGRWKLYDIDGRLEKEWEETM